MISVKYIYDRVSRDLSRKHMTGYNSPEEFTRDLRDSENILYEFYVDIFQKTQKVSDALSPFIKEVDRDVSDGFFEIPDNYRHFLEGAWQSIEMSGCGDGVRQEIPVFQLKTNSERYTNTSYVRKPSVEKGLLFWTPVNGKGKIVGAQSGKLFYKFLRTPVYGEYKTSINLALEVDEYDQAASKDLEWPEQEGTQIINLMLLHKGISVGSSDLMSFAVEKFGLEVSNNAGRGNS